MSVIVTVAAVGSTAIGAKVFALVATAAAAQLGLKAAQAATEEVEARRQDALHQAEVQAARAAAETVELGVADQAAVEQLVAERCELRFHSADLELVVQRDIRGRITVRAHGHGMSRAQVHEKAAAFLGLLRQQLAYRAVLAEVKRHGFGVTQEERQPDGTVRVVLARRRS